MNIYSSYEMIRVIRIPLRLITEFLEYEPCARSVSYEGI